MLSTRPLCIILSKRQLHSGVQNSPPLTWFLSEASPSFPLLPSLCWQSQPVPGHKVNLCITNHITPLLFITTRKASATSSPAIHKSFHERMMHSRNAQAISQHLTAATTTFSSPPLPAGQATDNRRAACGYLYSPSAAGQSPDPSPSECAPCHHPRTWTLGSTVSSSLQQIYPCTTEVEAVMRQPLWSRLLREGHVTSSRTPLQWAPQPCSLQLC